MRVLKLLIIVLALSGCVAAPSKTPSLQNISGVLAEDTILTGEYLLVADLLVPEGVNLTISPGSTIHVLPSESTKIAPEFLSRETEILIRGSLRAVGTAAQPISIKPVTEDSQEILWSGLQLVEAEQVELANLVIEQAETGVLCLNSSPHISSLHVLNSRYGIVLQQQSAPQISDILLAGGEAGLACWDTSAPQLTGSWIVENQEEGIYLGPDCKGSFQNNLIKSNDRGVVLPAGKLFDPSNRVTGNRIDYLRYPPEGD